MRKLRVFYCISKDLHHPYWSRWRCFKLAYSVWKANRARMRATAHA